MIWISATGNPEIKSGVALTASGYNVCQLANSGRKIKLANTPPSMAKVKKDNIKVTIYFFILVEF